MLTMNIRLNECEQISKFKLNYVIDIKNYTTLFDAQSVPSVSVPVSCD